MFCGTLNLNRFCETLRIGGGMFTQMSQFYVTKTLPFDWKWQDFFSYANSSVAWEDLKTSELQCYSYKVEPFLSLPELNILRTYTSLCCLGWAVHLTACSLLLIGAFWKGILSTVHQSYTMIYSITKWMYLAINFNWRNVTVVFSKYACICIWWIVQEQQLFPYV